MPYISDAVFDGGLGVLTANQDRLDVCSQEPTTYTEATSTYSLGNKAVTTGAAQDGAVDGRRVVIPAITDGSVTGTGTGTHWAGSDGAAALYTTGALSASQGLTSGNTFTLDAISITIRDAA